MAVKLLSKVFDFLSSIKLAVILILTMAVFFAYGTFYEAEHGTADAQRVVYKSWFSLCILFFLILNLAAAAIDRLPWKKHHIGFATTHMGIIILLFGSFITQQRGLDGSLALGINQAADNFTVPETEIQAYQNFDGRPFAILFNKQVDLDSYPPGKKDYTFPLVDDDVLKITNYISKAQRKLEIKPDPDPKALPAVKFTLKNDRVTVSEWLGLDGSLPPFYDLGPAVINIIKGPLPEPPKPLNQITFFLDKEGLQIAVFSSKQKKPTLITKGKAGDVIPTGWMNIELTIEEYIPQAKAVVTYERAPADSENHVQAMEARIGENVSWFEIGRPHEIKGDKSTYFINFTNRRESLGFKVLLNKFKMNTYQGSNLPMSYESSVTINDTQTHNISMNEPLDQNGFTLYQASFEQDEKGQPVTSILSVNYDPGRKIKYIGASLIVLGILIMFYFKPRFSRVQRN